MAGAISGYASSLALQLGSASGPRGKARVVELILRGRRERAEGAPPLAVPMRELGGQDLWARPGTSDLRNACYYYRDALHLPPPEVAGGDLRAILELGTNMGAALTALAVRYPAARVLGVEPDPGNAAVARKNLARFGERAALVEAGVWDADAELVVDTSSPHGAHGFSVRVREAGDPPTVPGVAARSIDSLLDERFSEHGVDYAHVSIEGTEPRVLAAGGSWAERIRSLRIEAHPALGYPAGECVAQLQALGYRAWPDPRFPDKWVLAVRA